MLAAVLACGPGAVLSHRSAAALWGLRPSDRPRVDVTAAARRGARDPGIDLHRARHVERTDVTEHRGVPVMTVARTFVDLAGVLDASALERALAQAEILGLYDHAALADVLDRSNGRRGAKALRAVLAHPPAFTRSDLEAHFLTLCDQHDLTRPLVNAVVCGHEVDFLWPRARLIVETDGHAYHRTRRAFEHDRKRDAELTLAGYRVLRFTYTRVTKTPADVADVVRALLTGYTCT